MTQNQIAYWNLKETQRHNEAQEQYNTEALGETKANNARLHQRETAKISETARHNTVSEAETERHNKMSESNEQTRNQAAYITASAKMIDSITRPVGDLVRVFV